MVKRIPALLACGVWMVAWWALYPTLGPKIKVYGLTLLGSTADYFFTYFGPELLIFLFGLLVLPILYWLLIRHCRWWLQAALVPVLLAGFVFIAYYDVVKIAREAEHLCTTEAGLHVYKTVEAEGFYGDTDITVWSTYGFRWLEDLSVREGTIRVVLENGIPRKQIVDEVLSRYEYRFPIREVVSRYIERSKQVVIDRMNGNILGDLTYFHIFRGWADRTIDFGLSFTPPTCWEDKPIQRGGRQFVGPDDLVRAVIKPKRNQEYPNFGNNGNTDKTR